MSKEIRKMIERIKNPSFSTNEQKEKQYKVFESRFYYSQYKDILFTGTYDECVQFIIQNKELDLEMLPIDNDNLSENSINESTLAIIGSRTFNNFSYAKKEILNIIQNNKLQITKIVSGGARGADKIAEIFASKFNIPIEVILPDWNLGKKAGVLRNSDIIKKSDYVIAFWDGKSKGTLDSINKSKKLNKKLFIVKISPENINEGVRLENNNTFLFDFGEDKKSDILSLRFNKNFVTSKKTDNIISYYSYKLNKNVDKQIRFDLLTFIKTDLQRTDKYELFLNKSIIGLFNNPNFDVADVDLILIPSSSSTLNFDLANKIKNKIPNCLFLKDVILKNEPENVRINYELLKEKGYTQNTIFEIEKMVEAATIDGIFKVKKIPRRFRRYISNFLKLDVKNRELLNKLVNRKVLVVDDIITEGTTFRDINRLIENYAPNEVILFSLIA